MTERQQRPISVSEIKTLWAHRSHRLRDRCYWAMAYDTAARANELLGLNIADLDIANSCAVVMGKGGNANKSAGQASPPGCCTDPRQTPYGAPRVQRWLQSRCRFCSFYYCYPLYYPVYAASNSTRYDAQTRSFSGSKDLPAPALIE